jgi:hypothetical protein
MNQGMVEGISVESRQYFSIWLIMWASAIFSVRPLPSDSVCLVWVAALFALLPCLGVFGLQASSVFPVPVGSGQKAEGK